MISLRINVQAFKLKKKRVSQYASIKKESESTYYLIHNLLKTFLKLSHYRCLGFSNVFIDSDIPKDTVDTHLSCAFYRPCRSHPPLHHLIYIWCSSFCDCLQLSCHYPIRSIYFAQHLVLKHSVCVKSLQTLAEEEDTREGWSNIRSIKAARRECVCYMSFVF
jgi:hypothetical protein